MSNYTNNFHVSIQVPPKYSWDDPICIEHDAYSSRVIGNFYEVSTYEENGKLVERLFNCNTIHSITLTALET